MNLDFIGLFIFIAGFIIGLGAVTVIDIHGFLGRKSAYWTEATTRTHKVTKPMIWIGIILAIVGGVIFYRNAPLSGIPMYHAIIAGILILNGLFLSFYVSPYLIAQERAGKQTELLPRSLQNKIILSLIISDVGWWGGLGLLVYYIVNH
jgi:Zn-dependent protease with chaperone function